jgi:hypothetical protein
MPSLLDRAVPLTTVLQRVRKHWRAHQRSEAELCIGLRRLFKDNLHRGAGRARFSDYIEDEIGMPGKMVWTFSILGRHLERLPLVREAMERGELTYTKAREFAARIDPEEQEHWIAFARVHTNREIEKELGRTAAAREGQPYEERTRVILNLSGRATQALRAAKEKLSKELDQPISMESLVPLLAEGALAGGPPGVCDPAASGLLPLSGSVPLSTNAARKVLPYATLCHCPWCATTWVPIAGENLKIRVERWVENLRAGGEFVNLLPDYLCDCEDVKHRRDQCPHGTDPTGEAATRRYMPAEEQKRISARDGYRCRTPGCTNSIPIENGHMEGAFRDGVPMSAAYVGHQCAACNRLIEQGRLRVVGYPPYEKYYQANGRFLGYGYDPIPFSRVPHVGNGSDRVRERPPGYGGGPGRAA